MFQQLYCSVGATFHQISFTLRQCLCHSILQRPYSHSALPSLQPCQKNLYLVLPFRSSLVPHHFHLLSCIQQMSTLCLNKLSTTSPDLPVMLPTFHVANLKLSSSHCGPIPINFPGQVYNCQKNRISV